MVRDTEQCRIVKLKPHELMEATFEEIDSCDIMIIDLSEKSYQYVKEGYLSIFLLFVINSLLIKYNITLTSEYSGYTLNLLF